MKFCMNWVGILFCSVIFTELLERSTCFSIQPRLGSEDVEQSEEPEITLISFLQNSVSKYGEKKVAAAIHELSQRSMYDLVWLLAGDVEPWLVFDFYKVYAHANSDPDVISIYERFKAGTVNRTIVPEVFALDRKYSEHEWWKRVRSRMLSSVDKYIGGSLKVNNNPPPKIDFTADGKPIVTLPGVVPAPAAVNEQVTTTEDTEITDPDDEDTDTEDSDNLLELLDIF